MASALIDGNPATAYTADYGWGRGVIFPLVYAVSWKIVHPFQHINPSNAVREFVPIMLVQGPFFMILALAILLAACLRITNPLVFSLALAFYLSIDPFFEVLNNGFIDAFYLAFVAIGAYFLVQVTYRCATKYSVLIGITCFVLPMIRANGLFYLLWSGMVFGYIFFLHRRDRAETRQLGKQILVVGVSFAACNLLYEAFIYAVDWQPQPGVMKHFPLLALNTRSGVDLVDLRRPYSELISEDSLSIGIGEVIYFHGVRVLSSLWSLPRLLSTNSHCSSTWLHLHYNIWNNLPVMTTVVLSNMGVVVYQLLRREWAIAVMYFGIAAHLFVQAVVPGPPRVVEGVVQLYEPRYYLFVYFGLSCPFFWLLNETASGNLHLRRARRASA
jgi:hypothetical protein